MTFLTYQQILTFFWPNLKFWPNFDFFDKSKKRLPYWLLSNISKRLKYFLFQTSWHYHAINLKLINLTNLIYVNLLFCLSVCGSVALVPKGILCSDIHRQIALSTYLFCLFVPLSARVFTFILLSAGYTITQRAHPPPTTF